VNIAEVEVLMVEDNTDDAALALRALKKHHLVNKVHVVSDGVEALEYIFGANGAACLYAPKVILLDLQLPKISGLEVLRKLKSDERTKTIPVVVLTSSREDQDVKECYRLGVNSYIVKPVDFDNFMHSVSELGMYWVLLNTPPV
jgi:two-component system response regulator